MEHHHPGRFRELDSRRSYGFFQRLSVLSYARQRCAQVSRRLPSRFHTTHRVRRTRCYRSHLFVEIAHQLSHVRSVVVEVANCLHYFGPVISRSTPARSCEDYERYLTSWKLADLLERLPYRLLHLLHSSRNRGDLWQLGQRVDPELAAGAPDESPVG